MHPALAPDKVVAPGFFPDNTAEEGQAIAANESLTI
jgi:hypothetical protein